jgi:surface polysaccharide O-acyltransferase-like enzyme
LGIAAMPLFFMVSGYLLIPRENLNYRYVIKKIGGIVKFVAIITLSFGGLYSVKHGFDIDYLFEIFLGAFIQKGVFSVFWYFGAILLCYLLLPLISKIYHCPRKYILLLGCLYVACVSIFSQTLTNVKWGGVIEFAVPATFRVWYIFFYFVLGGLIHRIEYLNKAYLKVSNGVVILLLCFLILYKELFDGIIGTEFASLFYSSSLTMLLCVVVFLKVLSLHISDNKFIRELSKLFLPVYTFHGFIISVVYTCVINYLHCEYIYPIVIFLTTCLVSVLVSFVVMKIPGIKTIFKI